MRYVFHRGRSGVTLIEILVILAIIGILVAMLLPAVQSAREAGRRATCQSRLKQLGLAIQEYHSVHSVFPPSSSETPYRHGWVPFLLDYIEQEPLETLYDWDDHWDSATNQAAVTERLSLLVCPSTPEAGRVDALGDGRTAAVSDFAPPSAVAPILVELGYVRPMQERRGMLSTGLPIRDIHVEDGLGTTLALVEAAGRPVFYTRFGHGPLNNTPGGGNPSVTNGRVLGAGWADSRNSVSLHGFTYDGLAAGGPCPINCTNNDEAFGFHPGGVNVVFGDGSGRFLAETIAIDVYASLITRNGGEIVDHASF